MWAGTSHWPRRGALAGVMSLLLAGCVLENATLDPDPQAPPRPDAGAAAPDAGGLFADAGPHPLADAGGDPGDPDPDDDWWSEIVAERPYEVRLPDDYEADEPAPLLVLLHGYGASSWMQELYLGIGDDARERGFIYVLPNGTRDSTLQRFWNATDACCNFYGASVDDVRYLDAVIADVTHRYAVDPRRIYLFGHSNGAFMANRYACERADVIAGIGTLAGMMWNDTSRCRPSDSVSVLSVHGSLDAIVLYGGGRVLAVAPPYPSAMDSAAAWGQENHCALGPDRGNDLDLDFLLPGDETETRVWGSCADGTAVEQWKIKGGSHTPSLRKAFVGRVLDFFANHPKY